MANTKMPDEGEIANDEFSYHELIKLIEEGYIHIPDFQREFVWNKDKILRLLDSIYEGYPIGSLVFWVTDEDFTYSAPIGGQEGKDSPFKTKLFVIDGQQRLKSLYHAAKKGELQLKGKKKPTKIDILFDLEREKFIFRKDLKRKKKKSALRIPGFEDRDFIFNVLEAAREDELESMMDKYDIDLGPIEKFLNSLVILGLLKHNERELTELGEKVLENEDREKIAYLLAGKNKFIIDALKIIKNNPSVTRLDARGAFQKVYGHSKGTAYHQFGRRCRWFRNLGLIRKEGENHFITEKGKEFLENLISKREKKQLRTVPLERILVDPSEIDLDYLNKFSKEKRKKINELRKQFQNYEFSSIIVNKKAWGEVCDIFERINTQGQKLTVIDLMIAKTWSGEEFNLREELRKFKNEIGDHDLTDITVLQSLSLNICEQCRRQDILGLDNLKIKKNWGKTLESIKKAIDFLKNRINLFNLDLIPFPALIVPLNKFYYELGNEEPSKEQVDKLERWFWKASVSNRFSATVESKLEEDGKYMLKLVQGEPASVDYEYVPKSVEDLIEQDYSLRNAFVKTILALLLSQEPLNPINNSPIVPDNFSRYTQTEMHHIFPKNVLRKKETWNEKKNSIVNIMFLPANINKGKSFKEPPSEYLSKVKNPKLEKALESHLIYDLEESGLLDNGFEKFLRYRARQILNKLKELTGEEKVIAEGKSLGPEKPFTNEVYLRDIIRQSNSYIYWFDKYFTRKGLEILAEEVDPQKVNNIKILSGVKQTNHKLRSIFKKFKEEMKNEDVNVEMRILTTDTIRDIHDRYLISENKSWNIPSLNTIGRGQYTEIKKSSQKPPFIKWWNEGENIIKDWNDIQSHLN